MSVKEIVAFFGATLSAQIVVQRTWNYFEGAKADWSNGAAAQAAIVAVLVTAMFAAWKKRAR